MKDVLLYGLIAMLCIDGIYIAIAHARKKPGAYLTRAAGERILLATAPRLSEDRCEECGGRRRLDCSPELVDHRHWCPGLNRYMLIKNELAEVLYK